MKKFNVNDWVEWKTNGVTHSGVIYEISRKNNHALIKESGVKNLIKVSLRRLHLFGDDYYGDEFE